MAEVLILAGLKTPMGQLPRFVFDHPIDELTRKMRLTRRGFKAAQFITAQGTLESGLNIYIDEIKENRESGTIDITYSHVRLEKEFLLENIKLIPKRHFIVGFHQLERVGNDVGGYTGVDLLLLVANVAVVDHDLESLALRHLPQRVIRRGAGAVENSSPYIAPLAAAELK